MTETLEQKVRYLIRLWTELMEEDPDPVRDFTQGFDAACQLWIEDLKPYVEEESK